MHILIGAYICTILIFTLLDCSINRSIYTKYHQNKLLLLDKYGSIMSQAQVAQPDLLNHLK